MKSGIWFAAGVYVLIVFLTLLAYAKQNRRMRFILKPVLIPSLMVLYYCAVPSPSLWVLLALGFGWIGDVFLLKKDSWNVCGGMASFALGHICYIIALLSFSKGWHAALLFGIVWEIFCLVLMWRFLIPSVPKKLKLPGIVYSVLLCGVSAVSLYRMITDHFLSSYSVCFFGGLLFFISDTLLVNNMLFKRTPLREFLIILTYIAAQSALELGFILHGGL